MPLHSLFIDFNSYFASVEQQDRPELRNRPVAVSPVVAETTCCIAASYEAKSHGVKTGTRISDARKICPGIQIVQARPDLYVAYHQRIVEILETCIHVEEVHSIDEMRCELTGKLKEREPAVALAKHIKETLRKKLGPHMRNSIGLAPNPFLAKTATDMEKPDGLIVIEESDLPDCLFRLELRDLCGIGHNRERRLHDHGIRTVKALCLSGKDRLRAVWGGIEGERFYAALRGESVLRPKAKTRSLGHSHVLAPEFRHDHGARAVLHRLLQKAAMRLRKTEYFAGGLSLSLDYAHSSGWSDEIRFSETQDTLELTAAMNTLWQRRPHQGNAPLKAGVTLFGLVPAALHTPSLFHDSRRETLHASMDRINLTFGKNAVFFGGAIEALDAAPMRIAFTRIPDPTTEA